MKEANKAISAYKGRLETLTQSDQIKRLPKMEEMLLRCEKEIGNCNVSPATDNCNVCRRGRSNPTTDNCNVCRRGGATPPPTIVTSAEEGGATPPRTDTTTVESPPDVISPPKVPEEFDLSNPEQRKNLVALLEQNHRSTCIRKIEVNFSE